MTGDLKPTDNVDQRIEAASNWLLGPRHTGIGELKERFGLSAKQAVLAIRRAGQKRRQSP